jgi:ferredoxin
MPTLTIDDQPVDVAPGTTILEAARRLGIQIPTLCHREGCRPETSCMVCVVRIGGSQKLVPSCATVAGEGMAVESETDEIRAARTMALELLLGDHLGDCVGPCRTICPAHLDIPKMIRQIVAGQMDAAVETVTASIPIPAILGRICPELCEKGCRRGSLDSPIAIRLLKRFVGDYALSRPASFGRECVPPSGKTVAVVGAGPAGLSAAYYLALQGHACTVFDSFGEPGGRLRYAGVPESALPREVLDAELDRLLAVGIELRPNTTVGRDVSLQELRDGYDAVLIATGDMQLSPAAIPDLKVKGAGIEADRHTQMTAIPGVFVAGGAVSPSRHAVRAVGSGHAAAKAISLYLAGERPLADHRPYTVTMGRLDEEELANFAKGYPRHGRLSPAGGEATGFDTAEARREGDRCLRCDCAGVEKCRLRDWAIAYDASPAHYKDRRRRYQAETTHPDVVYEPGKCINCGLCVQIAERSREALGLAFVGRGFAVRIAVPFGESFAEGLREVAAECATACPTGAIVLRERPLYAPATS